MARAKSDAPLDAPIPALHAERDALIRAVVDADDGDRLPYLVYADWQDDHGQSEHAELIRVMCAAEDNRGKEKAAEKKHLLARIKQLFATPALSPMRRLETNTYRYRRGFPNPSVLKLVADTTTRERGEHCVVGVGRMDPAAFLPFDKMAFVTLLARELVLAPDVFAELARQPWLSRVTGFDLMYTDVPSGGLAALASADLSGLVAIDMHGSGVAPDDAAALINSPNAANLRTLNLHLPSRPAFERLLAAVVGVRSASRFRVLGLNDWCFTDRAARIVLDSPHLTNVRKVYNHAELKPATAAALRERFGKDYNR